MACSKENIILLSAKPVREGRDLIIPFVKDGTEAFDGNGKRHFLTAAALQKDFATWKGGKITANHRVLEKGSIADTWYKDGYVYGRLTGLTDEMLSMIESVAYKGVSQESNPLEIVSPPKGVVLTNRPKFYRILHDLETMNYPLSNNYLYNQMSKTFLLQSVPQVMAS